MFFSFLNYHLFFYCTVHFSTVNSTLFQQQIAYPGSPHEDIMMILSNYCIVIGPSLLCPNFNESDNSELMKAYNNNNPIPQKFINVWDQWKIHNDLKSWSKCKREKNRNFINMQQNHHLPNISSCYNIPFLVNNTSHFLTWSYLMIWHFLVVL